MEFEHQTGARTRGKQNCQNRSNTTGLAGRRGDPNCPNRYSLASRQTASRAASAGQLFSVTPSPSPPQASKITVVEGFRSPPGRSHGSSWNRKNEPKRPSEKPSDAIPLDDTGFGCSPNRPWRELRSMVDPPNRTPQAADSRRTANAKKRLWHPGGISQVERAMDPTA